MLEGLIFPGRKCISFLPVVATVIANFCQNNSFEEGVLKVPCFLGVFMCGDNLAGGVDASCSGRACLVPGDLCSTVLSGVVAAG